MGTNDATTVYFLPASRVWKRYGVTSMTISRWLADERIAFPRPTYVGRFRYWRVADLQEWGRKRAGGKVA